MSVGRDHAERIAQLARLRFDDEELTRITAELNHILDYVESLKGVGPGEGGSGSAIPGHLATSGAPTVGECTPTRSAAAADPDPLASPLANVAPDWREGFFVVPPLPGMHLGEEG